MKPLYLKQFAFSLLVCGMNYEEISLVARNRELIKNVFLWFAYDV